MSEVLTKTQPSTKAKYLATSQMQRMVERYTQAFPGHMPTMALPHDEVVLLTGSTGSLGSYILALLVEEVSVTRIYALNRKDTRGDRSLESRQAEAFVDHGLDDKLLRPPKVVLVEGDTTLPALGVSTAMFEDMCNTVTSIIHNAWPVNFKSPLASMEPSIVQTRSLIDFALQSPHVTPPRLLFTSSESVYKNWDCSANGVALELPIRDPALSYGLGYCESKWVAETILLKAAEQTPLRPIVVRVGQLSGGSNGAWTPAEWIPKMVRVSQMLGRLPQVDGVVSWVPAHTAAAALVEMRKSDQPILHIVHPRPTSLITIIKHLAAVLNLTTVPLFDWIALITGSTSQSPMATVGVDQAARILGMSPNLLPIRTEDLGEGVSTWRYPQLSLKTTLREAPTMVNMPELTRRDVEEWVHYWRSIGFLEKKLAKL